MRELITDSTSKQRFWQLQKKAQGLCQCCGKPSQQNQALCKVCKAKALARYRAKHPLAGTTSCSLCHRTGHNKVTCPNKSI